jgi:phytoene desaturase
MPEPVVVIGAGIGGLSAAIRLAAAGRRVLVLEQSDAAGGKMGEIRLQGYRWDTGPSLITMRPVFEDLFRSAGKRLQDYLDLLPVEPLTRYFFANGSRLDATRDLSHMAEQIDAFDPRDVEGYLAFLAYAARLYRTAGPVFIFDQPPGLASLFKVSPRDALRFDGLRTMSQAINTFVRSPELRQWLGIFATYVGASPYQAPAALNMISHVELTGGVWYPQGGVYQISRAFTRLAQDLGVEICTNSRVSEIRVSNAQVSGVVLENGTFIRSPGLVANLDPALVYNQLLPANGPWQAEGHRLLSTEPSCSAFVLLLGVRRATPELAHHTTFFSSDYRREFEQIFQHHLPPEEPTIYISITSRTSQEDAPPGCENWFIQINVPALSPAWDWREQAESYAERVLDLLAQRGLDIRQQIEVRRLITPLDLELHTGAHRGALYGSSSNNRWAAFRRPHNRAAGLKGLYFAGGATHPGGGVPMVTLSGRVAAKLMLEDGY